MTSEPHHQAGKEFLPVTSCNVPWSQSHLKANITSTICSCCLKVKLDRYFASLGHKHFSCWHSLFTILVLACDQSLRWIGLPLRQLGLLRPGVNRNMQAAMRRPRSGSCQGACVQQVKVAAETEKSVHKANVLVLWVQNITVESVLSTMHTYSTVQLSEWKQKLHVDLIDISTDKG